MIVAGLIVDKRVLMMILAVLAVTASVPAQATSWFFGGQKKTTPQAAAVVAPKKEDGSYQLPVYMQNPDGNGFGTSADPKKMTPEQRAALEKQEARYRADAEEVYILDQKQKMEAEQQRKEFEAALKLLMAEQKRLEAMDAAARQAQAQGGAMPVAAGVPLQQQNATTAAPAQPEKTNKIKPYVAGVPVKQWDKINENKQNPPIKPYVVVPRNRQEKAE